MTTPLLAGAAAALAALALVAAWLLRAARHGAAAALLLCALAAALTAGARLLLPAAVPEAEVANRPIEAPTAGYVTSATCRACHAREHATWSDSYHHTMTQRPEPRTVLGSFDRVKLERSGRTWELTRRGDEFWVDMEDPMAAPGTRGARVQRKVVLTTGSHHMQLCWYETGFTRVMGLLPFVYLRSEQRWIPRQAGFVLPPTGEVLHEIGQWTLVCLKCHGTHSRPRADMDNAGLHGADTQVSELGIACEACHGPGEAHVRQNQDPLRRYARHFSHEPDPTIVNPARLDFRRGTDVCGQCHGIFDLELRGKPLQEFLAQGFTYRPGDDLSQTRPLPRKGMDEQFWPDGEPRVAGREFNGLAGSPCFERGQMTCLHCHQLHQKSDDRRPRAAWADDQLKPVDVDQTCLGCHGKYAQDPAAHSHHGKDSAGNRCVNCHMPLSTYGLLKGVRNHRIRSPSVATAISTGRPDACSLCHLDRTLDWVADALKRWYGTDQPNLSPDDRTYAGAVQWTLKGDAAQRALLAVGLGWDAAHAAAGNDWIAPLLAELLDDPYEAVRLIASRSLRTLPGFADLRPDVLAPATERAQAKAQVLTRWRQGFKPPGDARRAAVLIQADGSLDLKELQRLQSLRSRREVKLFE